MSATPGRRVRREDRRLVTGQGTFVQGAASDGDLHARFVRSYLAHGRIRSIDTSAALAAPGVVAVHVADDLGLPDIPGSTGRGPGAPEMSRPPLARDRVRYVGDPVAVVLAGSSAAAADAVERVDVELEPLPVVADAEAALRDGTILHDASGTNVVARLRAPDDAGDPDLDRWPVRVDVHVEHPRLSPVPLEPLGLLATPDADGGLVLRVGHQAPHRLRTQLSELLSLDEDRLRVVVPDTGGAFGMRGMLFPEYVVIAAAALRAGRSIHWVESRLEHLQGGTHGRGMSHRVQLAGEADGRVRAAKLELLADLGAYPHNGSQVPLFTRFMAQGSYDIDEVVIDTTMVVTNRAPTGSYRGAGRPEATYAIERAMEEFGRVTGLGPIEVRKRNLVPPEAMPYRSATGALYDSGDYPAALDLAVELLGLPALREEQARRRADGTPPLGIGFASFVERAGGAPDSAEYARVEVADDGSIVVRAGTAAAGQGHDTVWSALAAEVFDVDPDTVIVHTGDTGEVAAGIGTFASRSAQIAGTAIVRCSERVRDQLLQRASRELEVDPDDLEVRDGRVSVTGAPARGISLADLARAATAGSGADGGADGDANGDAGGPASEETYSPGAQTFPYGATAAVVEVDRGTGVVKLLRLIAVDDCGTVLDERIVEGQVHGSLAQGIGQALSEEVIYDEEGQPTTSTLTDYLLPRSTDVPSFETGRLEHPAPSNALGAKGAGETGCLGAPPAIVHAVLDALEPDGVTDLRMPLTPARVWRAIRDGAAPHEERGSGATAEHGR